MTLHVKKLAERLAFVGFLLLFPGFVVYHLLVMGLGLPPVLAGFFGPASAVLLIAFVPIMPKLLASCPRNAQMLFLGVVCLLTFLTAWSIAHRVLEPSPIVAEAYSQSWRAIALMSALFLVGLYLPLQSALFQRALVILIGIGGVSLVSYYTTTGASMFYARSFFGVDGGASYQGFARSALVVALLALISQKALTPRIAVAVSGLVVVWFLGARSELLGLAVGMLLFFGLVGLRRRSVLVSGVLLIPVIALLATVNIEAIEGSRHLQLFSLQEASSWQARAVMNEVAVSQIQASPILGAFGGHIASFGSSGAYAHNALSAWVSYGFVGFLGYVAMTLFAICHSLWVVVWKGMSDMRWTAALVFSVVVLLMMITTKSVFWPLPAFAWGIYGNALMSRKSHATIRDPDPEFSTVTVSIPRKLLVRA